MDSMSGKELLDALNVSMDLNKGEKKLAKRELSQGAYVANTPGVYEAKLQRVNFLGARKPGVVPNMWSAQEDELLKAAVEKYGDKNWRQIAEDVPGRTHLQCLQRWKKALRPGLIKGHWSKEEDQKLLGLITAYTEKGSISNINWAAISQQIPGRNAKQCRERWFLNLDPSINRGPWTAEEDERLLKLAAQCGGRWSLISRNMPGRTENSVKTRYHSLQRQEARNRGWTPEEDQTLLNATLVFGRDWGKVVKQLPGRSRGQLKKRFAALTQHNPNMVRQVQTVEDQLAKGVIVAPNPPPPPIQPAGAQSLQYNLQAQQLGKKPSQAPVVSPYVPNNVVAAPSSKANRAKGMNKRYGSSWMAGFMDSVPDAAPAPQNPSLSLLNELPSTFGRSTFGAQDVMNDFSTPMDPSAGPGQWGAPPPPPQLAAGNSKGLKHRNTSNMALLDKLLANDGSNAAAAAAAAADGGKSKGLKNYSSWGSIGGGDINAMFGANATTDTTTGGSGVPSAMRSGSDKKLNTMQSANWAGGMGGSSTNLNTYETAGELKNFLNMLS